MGEKRKSIKEVQDVRYNRDQVNVDIYTCSSNSLHVWLAQTNDTQEVETCEHVHLVLLNLTETDWGKGG